MLESCGDLTLFIDAQLTRYFEEMFSLAFESIYVFVQELYACKLHFLFF